MVAAERLEKIARERHMIGDGFGNLVGIDEICRLGSSSVGAVDEGEARVIEDLLKCQRIAAVILDGVRVWLDALQSEGGDSVDRPRDVMLRRPQGTGAAEKNIGIDGVERLVRNRGTRRAWRHEVGSRRDARKRQGGGEKFPPLESAFSNFHRHRHLRISLPRLARPALRSVRNTLSIHIL